MASSSSGGPSTVVRRPDRKYDYSPNTSIVLVGVRGTGTSTLAVMVASTLGYKLIDADQHFYQQTGLSRAAYKRAHGLKKYRSTEMCQLRSILDQNETKTVIVGGPGCVEETGRIWLSTYAKSHPVIYIMRDAEETRKYLSIPDFRFVDSLMRVSSPIYRSISSFEFYNIRGLEMMEVPNEDAFRSSKTLALKQVERDFMRLVNNVTGAATTKSGKSHLGDNDSSLESRGYTYALTLNVPVMEYGLHELMKVETIADAVELIIPVALLKQHLRGSMVNPGILDWMTHRISLARRLFQVPIIVNISLHPQFSQAHQDMNKQKAYLPQKLYFELLHHVLRLDPDYLCVDVTLSEPELIDGLVASKGCTKLMADVFNPHPGPNEWENPNHWGSILTAGQLGFDLMRICQPATCPDDNISLQHLFNRYNTHKKRSDPNRPDEHLVPLVAYNTGILGYPSHFMNKTFQPITTDLIGSFNPSSLLTLQQAQALLHTPFPPPASPCPVPPQLSLHHLPTLKFGIYGDDASLHALCPSMYSASFVSLGLPYTYNIHAHSTLEPLLNEILPSPDFGGMSITSPFKTEIISALSSSIKLTLPACAIGAVTNLIPLPRTWPPPGGSSSSSSSSPSSSKEEEEEGEDDSKQKNFPKIQLLGVNTDYLAIANSITRNLSPINAVKPGTTALVLGAGGMARAAVYALAVELGVKNVFVRNRTREKAEELARAFNNEDDDDEDEDIENNDNNNKDGNKKKKKNKGKEVSDDGNDGEGEGGDRGGKTKGVVVVRVLEWKDGEAGADSKEEWPEGFDFPTIVVSCIAFGENVNPHGGGDDVENGGVMNEVPPQWLRSSTGGVAVELAYTPRSTPFVRRMEMYDPDGWIVVDGLRVLSEQGAAQFELFTGGRRAPRRLMQRKVMSAWLASMDYSDEEYEEYGEEYDEGLTTALALPLPAAAA